MTDRCTGEIFSAATAAMSSGPGATNRSLNATLKKSFPTIPGQRGGKNVGISGIIQSVMMIAASQTPLVFNPPVETSASVVPETDSFTDQQLCFFYAVRNKLLRDCISRSCAPESCDAVH
jgi:hypothetical protein